MGEPKFRAGYGQWVPYAWIVRGLVENGHQVVPAVRTVVARAKLQPPERAARSIRAAYYNLRNDPWPPDIAEAIGRANNPGGDPLAGFDV